MNTLRHGVGECRPSNVEDVERELKGLRQGNATPHQNIVRLYDQWACVDTTEMDHKDKVSLNYFIVTELCHGGELFDQIESRMSEERIRSLFCDIVSGIAHLHSIDMCHCDLKLEKHPPRRQGSGQDNRFWECATSYPKMPTTSTRRPTIVPPEMLAGIGKWSICIILIALSCCVFPFKAAIPNDWRFKVVQHLQKQPKPRPSTVASLYEITTSRRHV